MRSCTTTNLIFGLGLSVMAFGACESKQGRVSLSDQVANTGSSVGFAPRAKASGFSSAGSVPSAQGAPMPPPALEKSLDETLIALEPCGNVQCARFDTAALALDALLDSKPRILAVGEAHALAGTEGIATATERFEKDLLPVVAKRGASELVVELLKPAPECTKPVEAVAKQEKQVTRKQSGENKNRFVSLGVAAKNLSVTPFLLEPECAAYQRIAEAGDDAVIQMLSVIKEETQKRVTRFYDKQSQVAAGGGVPLMVVAYGGAMHNDLEADDAKADFSFGPALSELSDGQYLELDLIVPEFIADTEVWKALPWYSAIDTKQRRDDATLIRTGSRSFVLIFPHSSP